jgi:hypothetical protein
VNEYAEVIVGDHGINYIEVAPSVAEGWRDTGLAEKLTLKYDKVMDTVAHHGPRLSRRARRVGRENPP